MQDFLLFNTFITPTLLLFFYYIGAVLIPLLSWYFAAWIYKNYLIEVSGLMKEEILRRTTIKQRIYTIIVFVLCFLCMEIFWRVLFEFFIAYFDMHDALMRIS
ncbi:DUF4282 domain-containing protein [Sulfurovum sp.]|uniref:DUF4282 domain-containing protein n=1 Tax=Sulfurovum sp. TaxID=1969726 RepID=UPI002867F1AE|nr:DUF4282 domain-containing protein [Sulfurovum sp.]